MFLVTGAAGKTGRAVIKALVANGHEVCGFVRCEKQAEQLLSLGASDCTIGDMLDAAAFRHAIRNVRAIYHICPNMHPNEVAIGKLAISAACDADVNHFVFHSVLHPQTEAMPHHWRKLRVEEALFESQLPFTILQPAAYMQNILANWDTISRHGVFEVPYSVRAPISIVDLHDIAEVAARVLTESGHTSATYELSGPEALTQTAVAEILSQVLDVPVTAASVPLDEWELRARDAGLGDYQVSTLLSMFRYYDNYGLCGSSQVLDHLLQREATTFGLFVQRVLDDLV